MAEFTQCDRWIYYARTHKLAGWAYVSEAVEFEVIDGARRGGGQDLRDRRLATVRGLAVDADDVVVDDALPQRQIVAQIRLLQANTRVLLELESHPQALEALPWNKRHTYTAILVITTALLASFKKWME